MKVLITVLVCLILVSSEQAFGQEKWEYDDYKNFTHKTFRKNKLFTEKIDFDHIDYPRAHAAIFFVTNEIREQRNLPTFEFNLNLEITAWNHSKAMAEQNFFAHINPKDKKRREPNDRAKIAGITNPYLAENVAETPGLQYKSGEEVYILDKENALFSYEDNGTPISEHTYLSFAEMVVDQWMHSKPHKKNILAKEGLELGCGIYLFRDKRFFNMPTFKATQNFQWYEKVKATESQDPLPSQY